MKAMPPGGKGKWLAALASIAICTALLVPSPPSAGLAQALLLVRVAALLVIPGLVLLLTLRPLEDADALQMLSFAPLASLALYPLLLLWLDALGGRWNAELFKWCLAAGVPIVCYLLYRNRRLLAASGSRLEALALGAIFAAALVARLWAVRGVLYPAGGDSYHHTIITQLILDNGRVPTNYRPYAAIDGFHYHYGYHAVTAFLAWITGLPAHRAVLWGGQVLNALTVPSLFFFVDRLAHDRRAAIIAAGTAALVCSMPANYVEWGRYPQLAGQLVFPVALGLACEAALRKEGWWRVALSGGLLAAGLGIIHYRIAIYYLAGVAILIVAALLKARGQLRGLGTALVPLIVLALIALPAISPWLPTFLPKTAGVAAEVAARGDVEQYDHLTLELVLFAGLDLPLLVTALVASLWVLMHIRRQPLGALTLAWLGLLIFLANPSLSKVLPSGFFTNGTVALSLYMPASVVIGLAASDLHSVVSEHIAGVALQAWNWLAALGLGAILLLGGMRVARQSYTGWAALFSPADQPAINWISENVPPDATFLVGYEFWLEDAISGTDGGYWIPYTTGHKTVIPPMVYMNEASVEERERINGLARRLYTAETSAEFAQIMREEAITHVYYRPRREQPWYPFLEDERLFQCVYDAEGVRIYCLR